MVYFMDEKSNRELKAALKNIASWIRKEREKSNLSQKGLSIKAGLSPNHVYAIEKGQRFPNMGTFLKICIVLNLNPAELFKPPEEERTQDRETVFKLLGKYL